MERSTLEQRVESGDPLQASADALIVPVAFGEEGLHFLQTAQAASDALDGEIVALATDARYSGKAGSTMVLPTLGRLPARRVVLAGIGSRDRYSADILSKSLGAAVRAASAHGARHIAVALPDAEWGIALDETLEASAVGAALGLYRFERHRGTVSARGADEGTVESITHFASDLSIDTAKGALRRAMAISDAVTLARDLGNEPGSVLNPETFAARALEVADAAGLQIEILATPELEALGAAATLAVGGGSATGPRLIRLRYEPSSSAESNRVVGLVGKAITFDTGGYSIKPYEGMLDMKSDMSGGAAVLATMSALGALDCPVTVEATICAAENMISGTAFRPGDVLMGMNGVTMEILSTDAEGRLVLADGLVDTARRGATELIDLATLTGAAVVALGNGTTALFSSDDSLAERLQEAASYAGERTWRMPLTEDLESKIKGDVADIKNTGGRAGGAITAALFLQHFTEGLPWAHLDIAGTARQDKASGLGPKGATGVGVRTLLRYLTA